MGPSSAHVATHSSGRWLGTILVDQRKMRHGTAWEASCASFWDILRPRNRLNYWACYRSNCLKLWKFIAWLWWLFCLRFVPTRSYFLEISGGCSLIWSSWICAWMHPARPWMYRNVRHMGCILPNLAVTCRHLHLVLPCAETGEQSACVLEALQRYA